MSPPSNTVDTSAISVVRGVGGLPAPIGEGRQAKNPPCSHRENRHAAGSNAQCSGERCQSEGPKSGRCALGPFAFPALAFYADQKADAERDGETQDHGIVKKNIGLG